MAFAPSRGAVGLRAFGPAGFRGLGGSPQLYTTAAQLRIAYYGTGDGVHWMYPSTLVSRLPDNADFPSSGVVGVGTIDDGAYIYPMLPAGASINTQFPGRAQSGEMLVWDQNGRLVSQFAVGGSGGGPQYATSLQAAYDPGNPAFGLDIQLPGGAFERFDPTLATSVAGRMGNLGESEATATTNAGRAAALLGRSVTPLPASSSVTGDITQQSIATPKATSQPGTMTMPAPTLISEPTYTPSTVSTPGFTPNATTLPVPSPTVSVDGSQPTTAAAPSSTPQAAGIPGGAVGLVILAGVGLALLASKRGR